MSSKKRKNDELAALHADEAEAAEQAASRSVQAEQIALPTDPEPEPDLINASDDASDLRRQLAAMQAERDQSRAELADARHEIETMRAAARVPCPRCDFHSHFAVRVRTMAGQVTTIACPDGPKTRVIHVKNQLAMRDVKWVVREQLTLVLSLSEASSSSSGNDADSIDPALADDRTLESYGVMDGGLLDLLVVDMDWNVADRRIIDFIKDGGAEIRFEGGLPFLDGTAALALSWALANAVCCV
jgi:hypothetical protein